MAPVPERNDSRAIRGFRAGGADGANESRKAVSAEGGAGGTTAGRRASKGRKACGERRRIPLLSKAKPPRSSGAPAARPRAALRCVAPVLLLALVLSAAACRDEPPPRTPNVILLVMDTTRADRLSLLGYDRDTSPALVALGREATVFTDAWSPAGWTAPAHASLFTGLRPDHHGLLRNTRSWLLPEFTTLAEIFRAGGYRTGCFTNNNSIAAPFGLTQGFEDVVPLYEDESRPYPWARETHRRALEWATRQHAAGERFFLFVNDMEPHFPYTPPADLAERFVRPGTPEEIRAWGRALPERVLAEHNLGIRPLAPGQIAHLSDLYDAEVRALDDAIGAFVEGLKAKGLLDDTVLVVTADHGECLGEHDLLDHVFSLHRVVCHVPLIVRFPVRFPPGERVDRTVRLEDVAPTLLELCALAPDSPLDGRSLLDGAGPEVSFGFLDPPKTWLERMAKEYPGLDPVPFEDTARSLVDGRHHLIRYSDGREELYDRRTDPAETENLAPRGGPEIERLRERMPR